MLRQQLNNLDTSTCYFLKFLSCGLMNLYMKSTLSHPINIKTLAEIVENQYGLIGHWKPLPGEEDHNFLLTAKDQKKYTVKVSRENVDPLSIEFQASIMKHLKIAAIPYDFPEIVGTLSASDFITLNNNQFLRIQKWVEGRMLGDINPMSHKVLLDWGKLVGSLSNALKGFDHPGAHRFYKWNPAETLHSKKLAKHFENQSQRNLANYFWDLFESSVLPQLSDLRKSVNYNDAHEMNLLVNEDLKNPALSGIIDFGDALYCETISELAIACAYAGMEQQDPLRAMMHTVEGCNSVFPIEELELEVLFSLITARLLITVSTAAENKFKEPGNKYLQVSDKAAWGLLEKLKAIHPNLAYYSFRTACGMTPCPKENKYKNWFNTNKDTLHPMVDFSKKKLKQLDLSIGSLDLGNNDDFENIDRFNKTIHDLLDGGNLIGFGGYLEARPIYTAPEFVSEKKDGKEWRTIHLGLDIWSLAGTEISCPLDAVVHSFANNEGVGNYGPTIILKHVVDKDLTFYTLYGHLSMDSLEELQVGMKIKAGAPFAKLGDHTINGNWPPHLHFQVILDILDHEADYPGVAFAEDKLIYNSLCPDPQLFFDLPFLTGQVGESQIIKKEHILESRKKSLGSSLSISYEEPLHIVRGYKQHLYNQEGRRFLDTCNNVPHVGHQHPEVVKAAQKQIAVLNTNTRYLHKNIISYAEKLLATFPPELSVVHFVNSGSEANELALRMARACTGQKDVISLEVGYHGNTNACIEISSYKFDGNGGSGVPEHTHMVPLPDTFRGRHKDKAKAGKQYADYLKDAIENIRSKGRGLSSFICEGIVSCGGQIVLPDNYLKNAFKHVRAAGGICIVDEVQVGFGRVGDKFWAFELQEVIPDIVTLGKPIGNGHPLAAVVCTRKVANRFANGMEFFNTFGGNPVSCAIGETVLDVIAQEGLQNNAKTIGDFLICEIRNLQKRFPIIGDVRGHGLFFGFELIKDKNTLEPAAEQASYLANRMKDKGILMSTDGPLHNVIKIKPPMCFNMEDAKSVLKNLELVFEEDFMALKIKH